MSRSRSAGPSRRAFLRGLGGSLALPLMPSLLPRRSWAAEGAPPQRLLVMWVPNGWPQYLFHPTGSGTTWEPSPIMAPVEAVRDKVLCLSHLDNHPSVYPIRYDEHAACTAATLSCAHAEGEGDAPLRGWSMDQLLADHLSGQTPFDSLQLGSEEVLRCYTPGLCPHFDAISWRGFQSPLPKDISVTSAFGRVFQGLDPSLSDAERASRLTLEQSLLDRVVGDLDRYKRDGSALDTRRLDQYLDGLRGLEQRLQIAAQRPACGGAYAPVDPGEEDPTARLQAMADLIALSLQCDQTRVITWMLGTGRSERSLRFLGHAATHHELSHEDTYMQEAHIAMGRWEVEQFVYMIQALDAVEESDGSSLLDHTTILFLSGIGEGREHQPYDMNVLLAGGGIPQLGQRIEHPEGTPLADLHIALMHKMGLEVEAFGDDGTGPLLTL